MKGGKGILILCLIYLVVSCEGREETLTINYPNEDCNILSRYESEPPEVKSECFFPFPFTQFYSGGRLSISDKLFRIPEGYREIDLRRVNDFDGFSTASQIMFWHPRGFLRESLPAPERTTESASLVQLIDHESGERIPVFCEPDERSEPPFQILYIRPLRRMRPNSRYVVVLKRGIKGKDRRELEPPMFFRGVLENRRMNLVGSGQSLEKWKRHFEGILSFLESHGVRKDEVLVAWDFKTASDELIIGENMVKVRDMVYRHEEDITFVIDDVVGFPHSSSPQIYEPYRNMIEKAVHGRFWVPRVDGRGFFEARFLLHIPRCVFQNPTTARKPMIFGHGLFGSTGELNAQNVIYSSELFCTPTIGTNWKGIDIEAFANVFSIMATRRAHVVQVVEYVVDNLRQGHANFLALAILVRKKKFWDKVMKEVGVYFSVLTEPVYYGISNGAIQGGTFMALTKDVTLGVLDVGGCVWTSMLERNRSWDALRSLMYPSENEWEFEVKKVIAIVQILFDIVDPVTFAPYVIKGDERFGIAPKKILYREALYDEQVANFSTRIFVRTAGIPAIMKLPDDVFGLEKIDATKGHDGSGYLQVDPKIDHVPDYQIKNVSLSFLGKPDPLSKVVRDGWPLLPDEGVYVPPHYVPRVVKPVLEAQKRFYEEGKIYQLCSDAICDPD